MRKVKQMSEPARKTEIDIAEYERRLRPAAPRVDDPLAELARLVGGPPEPPRDAPQPIDALSPQARAALTSDEETFLNELSLAIDRAPTPRAPTPADESLVRAHAAIGKVAEEARAAAQAEVAAPSPAAPAAQIDAPAPRSESAPVAAMASAAIVIPALKAETALRGGLDMRGLEEMTRLEDISRAAPAADAPALPKVNLHAPVFPRPLVASAAPLQVAPQPAAPLAVAPEPAAPEPILFEEAPVAPRDLDARLPGDDRFETVAPALAAEIAQERRPRSRRTMAAVVALLGVGVAATGVALTLKRGPTAANGEPPTIMASTDPVKVAPPAAPAAPADQADDLLAKRTAKPDGGAKAVGRPEEPVDLAKEAQKIVRTVPVAVTLDPAIPRTPTSESPAPDQLGSVFPEPKRVRTVSIRPDGTVVGAEGAAALPKPPFAAPAPAPAAAPVKASAPTPRADVAAVTPSSDAAAPSRGALVEDQAAAPRPRPRAAAPATQTPATTPAPKRPVVAQKPVEKPAPPRRVAKPELDVETTTAAPEAEAPVAQVSNPFANLFGRKDAQTAAAPTVTASTSAVDADEDAAPARPAAKTAVGSGSYGVQLSSSPSEDDARAAASRFGGRFSGALGGRAPRVVKGEAGGKTVYRVRVGGMSKEGAASSCTNVKSAGGACFVTHD